MRSKHKVQEQDKRGLLCAMKQKNIPNTLDFFAFPRSLKEKAPLNNKNVPDLLGPVCRLVHCGDRSGVVSLRSCERRKRSQVKVRFWNVPLRMWKKRAQAEILISAATKVDG